MILDQRLVLWDYGLQAGRVGLSYERSFRDLLVRFGPQYMRLSTAIRAYEACEKGQQYINARQLESSRECHILQDLKRFVETSVRHRGQTAEEVNFRRRATP